MGTGGGSGSGQGSRAGGSGGAGDPEGVLRESMEGYDREIARERDVMATTGQGSSGGSGGMGGMTGEPGGSGGAMVTIPNMSGGAMGGGDTQGGESAGSRAGGSGSGGAGGGEGGPLEDGDGGEPGDQPESKLEIPEDIAEVTGKEDQVARQIREAAEQEEDPRIRDALWDEYRKHMGLKKQ